MFLLLPLLIVAWLLLLFFLCTAIEFHFVRAYLFCVRTFKCCFLNVHASCTLIRFDWIFWMVSVANFHTYRNTWTRPRFIINVLNLSHQFRSFFSLSRYGEFFFFWNFFSFQNIVVFYVNAHWVHQCKKWIFGRFERIFIGAWLLVFLGGFSKQSSIIFVRSKQLSIIFWNFMIENLSQLSPVSSSAWGETDNENLSNIRLESSKNTFFFKLHSCQRQRNSKSFFFSSGQKKCARTLGTAQKIFNSCNHFSVTFKVCIVYSMCVCVCVCV